MTENYTHLVLNEIKYIHTGKIMEANWGRFLYFSNNLLNVLSVYICLGFTVNTIEEKEVIIEMLHMRKLCR